MADFTALKHAPYVALAAAALQLAAAPLMADDTTPWSPPAQKPQLQAATTNAKQAVGIDEIDGPTILEGIPALNGADTLRDTLRDRYGIYLHGSYLGDPYVNVSGGAKRGSTYSGRLDVEIDIDTAKTVGIPGGTLHANIFQIHGHDLSQYYVENFLSINDIGALPSTRLFELWYEQSFGKNVSIRAGQQGIDVEFLTSNYAGNFINATFGWPGLPSQDLADGGPAYPLAAPAVHVRVNAGKNLSVLAAVFDGQPAGPCPDDPQTCNRDGLNFRTSDPPLVILETQYRFNRDTSAALPGTLKIGAFQHFGTFPGQQFGADRSDNPHGGSSIPITLSPGSGLYAIIDQQVFRAPGDDPENGVGIFARIIGAPSGRSPIPLYADAGIWATGLVPARPDDMFGIAAAFAKISRAALRADQAAATPMQIVLPARGFEAAIEITYQVQIVPGLAVQPTFEYIVHPSGDIVGQAGRPPQRNAAILGVTTSVRF